MPTVSEQQVELYRIHSQSTDKYQYYLLSAQGAAIAFAVTQTGAVPLNVQTIPLMLALGCWAYGIYAGCRSIRFTHAYLHGKILLLNAEQEECRIHECEPKVIEEVLDIVSGRVEDMSERAATFGDHQFPSLVAGALFFIFWHLLRMALLNPALAEWLGWLK